jgi:hypothetical protein
MFIVLQSRHCLVAICHVACGRTLSGKDPVASSIQQMSFMNCEPTGTRRASVIAHPRIKNIQVTRRHKTLARADQPTPFKQSLQSSCRCVLACTRLIAGSASSFCTHLRHPCPHESPRRSSVAIMWPTLEMRKPEASNARISVARIAARRGLKKPKRFDRKPAPRRPRPVGDFAKEGERLRML